MASDPTQVAYEMSLRIARLNAAVEVYKVAMEFNIRYTTLQVEYSEVEFEEIPKQEKKLVGCCAQLIEEEMQEGLIHFGSKNNPDLTAPKEKK